MRWRKKGAFCAPFDACVMLNISIPSTLLFSPPSSSVTSPWQPQASKPAEEETGTIDELHALHAFGLQGRINPR